MLIVALVTAWVVVALVFALVVGRAVAVSEKSDRWRHGHRETRDLRRLHPVPSMVSTQPASEVECSAA